jgi:alpha-D-ribose 1-methylphosphonate 5-triphosphate synthase subunit PhnG
MTSQPLERRHWMEIFANAEESELEDWFARAAAPPYTWLRRPETGLVMVRGRIGGTGDRFNLGEMTVTRCALRVADATTGVAYVTGRSARHAELAALADALMQIPEQRPGIEFGLLGPLAEGRSRRTHSQVRQAAATRVDFFALVRGDN